MWSLLLQIAGSTAGLWLADRFVPGVNVLGDWKTFVLIGTVLGAVNFFLRPLLNVLTLPLKILTLGLFGFIVNMLLVWLVDIAFTELVITGIVPLFWTTVIIWLVIFALTKWMPDK
ncbi:MAG: phage holin family protein [bacterium]|nr:phage holin family protein [bacterium]